MKFFKFRLLALIATINVLVACSTDDADNYCFQSVNTGIDAVTGPQTTSVNEEIILNATFNILNGCGKFSRFAETGGTTRIIYARVDYMGCTCTDILQTVTKPYAFKVSEPGEYVLKFAKPDGTFITKTITVTEE